MRGYKTTVQSEYYRDLKKLIAQFGAGRGTFLPVEIAEAMGALKRADGTKKPYSSNVTFSLRRALAQAEIDKLVTPCSMLTKRGGRAIYFEVHVALRQMAFDEAPIIEPPF